MDNKDPIIDGGENVLLPGKQLNDMYQADEGLQTLRVMEEEHLHLDATTSKRLRRRADMLMMPVRKRLYDTYGTSVA